MRRFSPLAQVPNSLAEWKNQSFYVSGAAPSGTSSDVIEIPRGMTVTVTDRQTDVVSFLNAVGNIKVLGSTDASQSQGKLVLDVSEGATVEFTGCIRDDASGSTYAKVEKVGKGALKLKNVDAQAYCSSWNVAEGELWLPPPDVASVYTHVKSYGLVWVALGAVLRTDLCAETFLQARQTGSQIAAMLGFRGCSMTVKCAMSPTRMRLRMGRWRSTPLRVAAMTARWDVRRPASAGRPCSRLRRTGWGEGASP